MKNSLYNFAKKMQQFPRSLTGAGNRQTLSEIKKILPSLKTKRIKSGKKVKPNFQYTSDNNPDWMTRNDLKKWILENQKDLKV